MFDAELYRTKEEVEEWKKRDPIATFRALLEERGFITAADIEKIESGIEAEIDDAVEFAETSAAEPVEELERFVYSDAGGAS